MDQGTSVEEPPVLEETIGHVRVLRLNRPRKLNALDSEIVVRLLGALNGAEADDAVRAVVLCAEGRAFCAGGDLREFKGRELETDAEQTFRTRVTKEIIVKLRTMPKPVVAAVQGVAAGGGAALAIGCDMMVMSEDAQITYPEIDNGLVPAIVLPGLQRGVASKIAFEIASMNRPLTAPEAMQYDLANRVVTPDVLLDTALEIANRWSECAPAAMAGFKSLFYRVGDVPFAEAMEDGFDAAVINRLRRPQDAVATVSGR